MDEYGIILTKCWPKTSCLCRATARRRGRSIEVERSRRRGGYGAKVPRSLVYARAPVVHKGKLELPIGFRVPNLERYWNRAVCRSKSVRWIFGSSNNSAATSSRLYCRCGWFKTTSRSAQFTLETNLVSRIPTVSSHRSLDARGLDADRHVEQDLKNASCGIR